MKILTLVMVLVVVNFSVVLAAPWYNPSGYWMEGVYCGNSGPFDVWVINFFVSFDNSGQVGIMKALYRTTDGVMEPLYQVPGNGIYKKTIWCTWEMEGDTYAGQVLIP